jgi:alanyl-tRNA synthetase
VQHKLYDTFGFPIEFTVELAQEKGYFVDLDGFQKKFAADHMLPIRKNWVVSE